MTSFNKGSFDINYGSAMDFTSLNRQRLDKTREAWSMIEALFTLLKRSDYENDFEAIEQAFMRKFCSCITTCNNCSAILIFEPLKLTGQKGFNYTFDDSNKCWGSCQKRIRRRGQSVDCVSYFRRDVKKQTQFI